MSKGTSLALILALTLMVSAEYIEPIALSDEAGVCGNDRGLGVKLSSEFALASDASAASQASFIVLDLAFNYDSEDVSSSPALIRMVNAVIPNFSEFLVMSITSPTSLIVNFAGGDSDVVVDPSPVQAVNQYFSRLLVIINTSANEFTVWRNNELIGTKDFPGLPAGAWQWRFRVNIDITEGEASPGDWNGILDHFRIYEGEPTEDDINTLFTTNTKDPPGLLSLYSGYEFTQNLGQAGTEDEEDWVVFTSNDDLEPLEYACGKYSTWFDRNTGLAIAGSVVAFIATGAGAYLITAKLVLKTPQPTVPRRAGDRAYTGKLATGKPKKDRTAPPSYRVGDPNPDATQEYATQNGGLPQTLTGEEPELAGAAAAAAAEGPPAPVAPASGAAEAPTDGARSGSPRKRSPKKKRRGSGGGSRRKAPAEGGEEDGGSKGSKRGGKGKRKKSAGRTGKGKKPAVASTPDPVLEDDTPDAQEGDQLLDLPSSAPPLPTYDQYISSKKGPVPDEPLVVEDEAGDE